jgi:hypothetical protein
MERLKRAEASSVRGSPEADGASPRGEVGVHGAKHVRLIDGTTANRAHRAVRLEVAWDTQRCSKQDRRGMWPKLMWAVEELMYTFGQNPGGLAPPRRAPLLFSEFSRTVSHAANAVLAAAGWQRPE